jgi:phage shock protein C
MNTTARRLVKSRTDRMVDGVCGGIAAYFSIDATLIRILWVLLTIFGGSGVLLYIAAMIVMPKAEPDATVAAAPPKNHAQNTRFWGILLVVVGALWLMGNLGVPIWYHWWGLPLHIGVPVLLILAGVAFLFGGRSYVAGEAAPAEGSAGATIDAPSTGAAASGPEKLYRSRTDKKIMGVCGGIGAHVNVDPVIIRLLFVAGVLASCGFFVLLYIIMGIIIPQEPAATVTAA